MHAQKWPGRIRFDISWRPLLAEARALYLAANMIGANFTTVHGPIEIITVVVHGERTDRWSTCCARSRVPSFGSLFEVRLRMRFSSEEEPLGGYG